MSSLSTISAGTVVRGSIRGEGDLDIHGRVEGSIELAGEVLIAETALIASDVRARRVVVRGAVAGNISADESIVLEPGARVAGDLGAPQIGIRPGGLVRGHVSTDGPLPVGERAPQAAAKGRPAPPARAAAAPVRPAARPVVAAPARPVARPAPPPARPVAPVVVARPAPPSRPEPARVEAPIEASDEPVDLEETSLGEPDDGGPPPPVVPALRKGAKAQLKRKGAR